MSQDIHHLNISITKVQPPSGVSLTTASHKNYVSKQSLPTLKNLVKEWDETELSK